jgi:hypothetical protein
MSMEAIVQELVIVTVTLRVLATMLIATFTAPAGKSIRSAGSMHAWSQEKKPPAGIHRGADSRRFESFCFLNL